MEKAGRIPPYFSPYFSSQTTFVARYPYSSKPYDLILETVKTHEIREKIGYYYAFLATNVLSEKLGENKCRVSQTSRLLECQFDDFVLNSRLRGNDGYGTSQLYNVFSLSASDCD